MRNHLRLSLIKKKSRYEGRKLYHGHSPSHAALQMSCFMNNLVEQEFKEVPSESNNRFRLWFHNDSRQPLPFPYKYKEKNLPHGLL